MAEPLTDVELKGVSKFYGDVLAVDDVSLAIRRGEFFSLLGSSGCGKSTTLRMIGGMEDVSRGDLFIRGERVNDVQAHRRATNMVFQHLGLFPYLTVFDNVAFGLRMKRVPRGKIAGRVKEYLDLVSLSTFADRYPDQLSGGQQQRVAIARALVNEPAVLLLDEPLGALDLKLRMQMQQELKALQSRLKATFVYVTHDQGEAFAMSDRIAVMRDGRIQQIGTPAEIYRKPANRFVADFVGETNLLDATVAAGGDDSHGIVQVRGLRIPTERIPDAVGAKVTLSVRPEHVDLSAGSPLPSSIGVALIRSVIFQGSMVQITLESEHGFSLAAKVVEGTPASRLCRGEKVHFGWQPINARILS